MVLEHSGKPGKFRKIKKMVVILGRNQEILFILILVFINTLALFIVHFTVVVAGFSYSYIKIVLVSG